MKPTLILTIGKGATREQKEKAVKKVYELSGEFAIIVLTKGEKEGKGEANVSLFLKVGIFKGKNERR